MGGTMRLLLSLILCLSPALAWADHSVVIRLKEPTAATGEARTRQIQKAQKAAKRVMRGHEYTIKRDFGGRIPWMAVRVDDHGMEALEDAAQIEGVSPDYEFETQLLESIPLIGANVQHRAGFLGTGWAVAVLDTGLDLTHSAFAGGARITAEACFTDGPQCPDGTDSQIGPGASAAIHYHGTHVAGICCGSQGGAGLGVLGVAPRSDIIGVQVFTRRSSGGISASFSDIIQGILWVASLAEDGTQVASINMSLGTGAIVGDCTAQFQAIKDASDIARAAGVGVIAASGNGGSANGVSSPGCIQGVIATGCTSKTDTICSFSNEGPMMQIRAPGLQITSAALGGGQRVASGTSMSTPMVAGAYALLRDRFPGIGGPDNVQTMLESFGKDILGRPRLDLAKINAGQPPDPPDPNTPQCPDCPDTCADADGDGEQDSRDRCPGTPAGLSIDDAGCSHEQWCHTIVPGTWRDKGDCRAMDWGNNEPRNAKDCQVDRNGWGSSDDECVPR